MLTYYGRYEFAGRAAHLVIYCDRSSDPTLNQGALSKSRLPLAPDRPVLRQPHLESEPHTVEIEMALESNLAYGSVHEDNVSALQFHFRRGEWGWKGGAISPRAPLDLARGANSNRCGKYCDFRRVREPDVRGGRTPHPLAASTSTS